MAASEATPILQCTGLSKRFGGVHALEKVSFELYPGEVLALAGDNGAGKSTLIKAVAGVHQPDEGQIVYNGAPVTFSDPREARNAGIETIYQDLALADNLDVGANVFLGREPERKLFGLLPAVDRARMRQESRGVLDQLDIEISEGALAKPVRSLSGGQRQAVAIGRAIFWNASVLIHGRADGGTRGAGATQGDRVGEEPEGAKRRGDLHLPQPGRHLCRGRPNPGAAARQDRGRAASGPKQTATRSSA